MGSKYIERITHIEQLLLIENKIIDKEKLREECSYGIPDLLRPLCWRLFLHYLPNERNEWKNILKQQRLDYQHLVENLIIRPGEEDDNDDKNNLIDHPLASESTSKWANFYKDNEILLQIDRDVRRLRPEIQFFQMKTNFPLKSAARINLSKRLDKERLVSNAELEDSSFLSSSTASTSSDHEEENDSEYHWQVVERILFIYSKVNPGIKYVQGMNELIGPIYYVFATDPDKEWAEYAECDTFYCFQHLMSELKDNFIKTLDQSNCGIDMVLNNFHERLRIYDSELYMKLIEEQSIKPQFYALRWILLLLSQEFNLPDLIFLWDGVLSSKDRLNYIQYICLEMLTYIRNDLLNGDFSTNIRLLQNFPFIDISKLMIKANERIYDDLKHNSSLNSSITTSTTTSDILNTSNKSNKSIGNGLFSNKLTLFMNEAKDKLRNWKKDDST